MGKRDTIEDEPEPDSIHSRAKERMIRLQRRACALMVLERAGIEPVSNPSPFHTVEESDALEQQVAEAGLTGDLEASVEAKEWAYRG